MNETMKRILFGIALMAAATTTFAQSNDKTKQVAGPMEDVNHVIDNTVDSLNEPQGQQPCAFLDRQLYHAQWYPRQWQQWSVGLGIL